MMANLQRFIDPESDLFRPSKKESTPRSVYDAAVELSAPADLKIEIPKFMKWNVLASMPPVPVGEEKMFNPVENYSWMKPKCVKVKFDYYRHGKKTSAHESAYSMDL